MNSLPPRITRRFKLVGTTAADGTATVTLLHRAKKAARGAARNHGLTSQQVSLVKARAVAVAHGLLGTSPGTLRVTAYNPRHVAMGWRFTPVDLEQEQASLL